MRYGFSSLLTFIIHVLVAWVFVSCDGLQNSIEVKVARDAAAADCDSRGTCIKDPRGLLLYNPDLVTESRILRQQKASHGSDSELLLSAAKLKRLIKGIDLVGPSDSCDSPKGVNGTNPTLSKLLQLKEGLYKACIAYVGEGLVKRVFALEFFQVDTTPPQVAGGLSYDSLTSNSVSLNWSKPGDNLTIEGKLVYTFYTSRTQPLGSLSDVKQFGNIYQSQLLGGVSFTLKNMEPNTPHYAAVVVSDEAGNESLVGNTYFQTKAQVSDVTEPPVALPPSGIYSTAQSISLSSATPGASIYYTVDGSTPTPSSTPYTGPIAVLVSQTIKAIATKANFSNSTISSADYTINGAVAIPVASVASGVFSNNQTVTLATVPMAASIYYTVDGSTPTPSSTPYTGTIPISQTTTLKAIAVMANYIDSGIMSETYTVTAATPTADIPAGAYGPTQTVTLSSQTTDAVVYYTTDGSTPTCSGATGSFDVLTTVTIKAIACKNNYNNSEVAIFPYTINGQVAAPTMSVVGGTYNNDQSVTLSTTTPGATIYYTTDGSTPTTASHVYSSAITISASQTIKAYAMKANYIDSGVGTEQYDMVVSRPIPSILPDYQYLTAQSLTFSSATIGAVIHYTTDGSTPTCDSATGTFEVTSWINVIAIACKDGYGNSERWEFTFFANSMTPRAVEAFPDTSGYPNITWHPAVEYSLSEYLGFDISFYSDTIGTSIADFLLPDPGRNLAWLNQETSLGVTKNVYAKANGSSEYIPMGSYSTNYPPSFSGLSISWRVSAMARDTWSPGCTTGTGCVILGGSFTRYNEAWSAFAGGIIKIKSDGSVDNLGGGLSGNVAALAVDTAGNIYAGGSFICRSGSTSSGTYPSKTCAGTGGTMVLNNIAKWDGTSWTSLGSGMDYNVNALAFDSSGNLYAGGSFTSVGGTAISRIAKWDGTAWSAVGSPWTGGGSVSTLSFDSSGNLYAGGSFTAGGAFNRIAKWDGTAWSSLGSGMNNSVSALAFDSSGNLYAGGSFTSAGGTAISRIAKWDGTAWSALGSGMNNSVSALAFDSSGNLYAGGSFTSAGEVTVDRITMWDGTAWSALGSGMSSQVRALVFDSYGNLYAGGDFFSSTVGQFNYAAKWNGASWGPLDSTVDGQVLALAKDGSGSIYAGGRFKTTRMLAANYVGKWNGDTWSGFGSGMNNIVNALAVDSQTSGCTTLSNPCLYAGGDFTMAGGSSANYIAKWSGASWNALGSGTNGPVSALVMDSSGNLYVGGNFTTADGLAVNYIAKWNGVSWSALGTGLNGEVNSLTIDGNGNLFAGGAFTTAGGITANYIARWNGTSWSSLGTGMSGSGTVVINTLATDSAGNLYAGGAFTSAGGVSTNNVAIWNGSAWNRLGGGLSAVSGAASISSLAMDSSGNLYAGGAFTAASLTQLATTTTASSKTITLPSVEGLEVGMSCSGSNVNSSSTVTDINAVTNVVTISVAAGATGPTTLSFFWPRNFISRWDGSSWKGFVDQDSNSGEPNAAISVLLIDDSGNLYAGGGFTIAGINPFGYFNHRAFLAKWLKAFDRWF